MISTAVKNQRFTILPIICWHSDPEKQNKKSTVSFIWRDKTWIHSRKKDRKKERKTKIH